MCKRERERLQHHRRPEAAAVPSSAGEREGKKSWRRRSERVRECGTLGRNTHLLSVLHRCMFASIYPSIPRTEYSNLCRVTGQSRQNRGTQQFYFFFYFGGEKRFEETRSRPLLLTCVKESECLARCSTAGNEEDSEVVLHCSFFLKSLCPECDWNQKNFQMDIIN